MGKKYGIGRKRAAIAMARAATSAEARLIHHDLAGRRSVKAAMTPPFMLARKGPATRGEHALLHLPARSPPPGKPGRGGR
jgi:hypothetical protein